ncbi:MAG: hypothetical protein ABH848_03935, partial [Candidatus Omnitrophota bacterium]
TEIENKFPVVKEVKEAIEESFEKGLDGLFNIEEDVEKTKGEDKSGVLKTIANIPGAAVKAVSTFISQVKKKEESPDETKKPSDGGEVTVYISEGAALNYGSTEAISMMNRGEIVVGLDKDGKNMFIASKARDEYIIEICDFDCLSINKKESKIIDKAYKLARSIYTEHGTKAGKLEFRKFVERAKILEELGAGENSIAASLLMGLNLVTRGKEIKAIAPKDRIYKMIDRLNSVMKKAKYDPPPDRFCEGTFEIQDRMNMIINLMAVKEKGSTVLDSESLLVLFGHKIHQAQTEENIDDIKRELIFLYAPMAESLGDGNVAGMIKNSVFERQRPEQIEIVRNLRSDLIEEDLMESDALGYMINLKNLIEGELSKVIKNAKVLFRVKTEYSMYKKLKNENPGMTMDQIAKGIKKGKIEAVKDILGIKVVVEDNDDLVLARNIVANVVTGVNGRVLEIKDKPAYNEITDKPGYRCYYGYIRRGDGRNINVFVMDKENYQIDKRGLVLTDEIQEEDYTAYTELAKNFASGKYGDIPKPVAHWQYKLDIDLKGYPQKFNPINKDVVYAEDLETTASSLYENYTSNYVYVYYTEEVGGLRLPYRRTMRLNRGPNGEAPRSADAVCKIFGADRLTNGFDGIKVMSDKGTVRTRGIDYELKDGDVIVSVISSKKGNNAKPFSYTSLTSMFNSATEKETKKRINILRHKAGNVPENKIKQTGETKLAAIKRKINSSKISKMPNVIKDQKKKENFEKNIKKTYAVYNQAISDLDNLEIEYPEIDTEIITLRNDIFKELTNNLQPKYNRIITRNNRDGFISQGDQSMEEFMSNRGSIVQNDITDQYRDRIKALVYNNIDRLNISDAKKAELKAKIETLKIYGFNSIVKGKDDFFLGNYNYVNNELFLSSDLLTELENRGPPSLVDEYLFHEVLCPTTGHYPAIGVQKQVFPIHYIDNLVDPEYKGILGESLRNHIDQKLQNNKAAGQSAKLTGDELSIPQSIIISPSEKALSYHSLGNIDEVLYQDDILTMFRMIDGNIGLKNNPVDVVFNVSNGVLTVPRVYTKVDWKDFFIEIKQAEDMPLKNIILKKAKEISIHQFHGHRIFASSPDIISPQELSKKTREDEYINGDINKLVRFLKDTMGLYYRPLKGRFTDNKRSEKFNIMVAKGTSKVFPYDYEALLARITLIQEDDLDILISAIQHDDLESLSSYPRLKQCALAIVAIKEAKEYLLSYGSVMHRRLDKALLDIYKDDTGNDKWMRLLRGTGIYTGPVEDSFIAQGEGSVAEFLSNKSKIRKNDITSKYQNRIKELITANIDKLNIPETKKDELKKKVENINIYGFSSIVKGKDDFLMGHYDPTANELFLSTDLIAELENRGPPSLVDEYLLHELIEPIIGNHYDAIKAQKEIFPGHYKENQDKGELGTALREHIDRKLREKIDTIIFPSSGNEYTVSQARHIVEDIPEAIDKVSSLIDKIRNLLSEFKEANLEEEPLALFPSKKKTTIINKIDDILKVLPEPEDEHAREEKKSASLLLISVLEDLESNDFSGIENKLNLAIDNLNDCISNFKSEKYYIERAIRNYENTERNITIEDGVREEFGEWLLGEGKNAQLYDKVLKLQEIWYEKGERGPPSINFIITTIKDKTIKELLRSVKSIWFYKKRLKIDDRSLNGLSPYRRYVFIHRIMTRNKDILRDKDKDLIRLITFTPRFEFGKNVPENIREYICSMVLSDRFKPSILETASPIYINYTGDNTDEDWFLNTPEENVLYGITYDTDLGPNELYGRLSLYYGDTKDYYKQLGFGQSLRIYETYHRNEVFQGHVWSRSKQIYSISYKDASNKEHKEKWIFSKNSDLNKVTNFKRDTGTSSSGYLNSSLFGISQDWFERKKEKEELSLYNLREALIANDTEKAKKELDEIRNIVKNSKNSTKKKFLKPLLNIVIDENIDSELNRELMLDIKALVQDIRHVLPGYKREKRVREMRKKYLDVTSYPEKEYRILFEEDGIIQQVNKELLPSLKNTFTETIKNGGKIRGNIAGGVSYYEDGPKLFTTYQAIIALIEGGIPVENLEVVVTDRDLLALKEAKKGIFNLFAFITEDYQLTKEEKKKLKKYFDITEDGRFQVKKEIRDLVKTSKKSLTDFKVGKEDKKFHFALYNFAEYKIELYQELNPNLKQVMTKVIETNLINNLLPQGMLITTAGKWFDYSWMIERIGKAYPVSAYYEEELLEGEAKVYKKLDLKTDKDWEALIDTKFKELMEKIRVENNGLDLTIINTAYEITRDAHSDLKRGNGEPYIIHPLGMAMSLVDTYKILALDKMWSLLYGMQKEEMPKYGIEILFAVTFLHDIIEEFKEGETIFGKKISSEKELLQVIRGIFQDRGVDVTTINLIMNYLDILSRKNGETKEQHLDRILASDDHLVIFVKIVDRYNNLSTPRDTWSPDKAASYKKDTMAWVDRIDKSTLDYAIGVFSEAINSLYKPELKKQEEIQADEDEVEIIESEDIQVDKGKLDEMFVEIKDKINSPKDEINIPQDDIYIPYNLKISGIDKYKAQVLKEPKKHLIEFKDEQLINKETSEFKDFNQLTVKLSFDIVCAKDKKGNIHYFLGVSEFIPGNDRPFNTWVIVDEDNNFISLEENKISTLPGQFVHNQNDYDNLSDFTYKWKLKDIKCSVEDGYVFTIGIRDFVDYPIISSDIKQLKKVEATQKTN